MKHTFLFFAIIFLLISCTKTSSKVDNVPAIESVKLGNLEIMTTDLGKMTQGEGASACAKVGSGWRLPTKDEMILIAKNQDKVPKIVIGDYYWTSTIPFADGNTMIAIYSPSLAKPYAVIDLLNISLSPRLIRAVKTI